MNDFLDNLATENFERFSDNYRVFISVARRTETI